MAALLVAYSIVTRLRRVGSIQVRSHIEYVPLMSISGYVGRKGRGSPFRTLIYSFIVHFTVSPFDRGSSGTNFNTAHMYIWRGPSLYPSIGFQVPLMIYYRDERHLILTGLFVLKSWNYILFVQELWCTPHLGDVHFSSIIRKYFLLQEYTFYKCGGRSVTMGRHWSISLCSVNHTERCMVLGIAFV